MDLMQVRRRRAGIIDWLRANGSLNRTPLVVYTSAGMDEAELPRLASGRDGALPRRALDQRRGAVPDRGPAGEDRHELTPRHHRAHTTRAVRDFPYRPRRVP